MSETTNQIGIMSYVYLEHSAKEMAAEIASHGIKIIQADPRQKGLLDLNEEFDSKRAKEIRQIFSKQGISIPVLSAYMNLVDPDLEKREQNLLMMEKMIKLCPEYGASYIATETGSFHPTNQWRDHPDNHTEKAWETLVAVIERLQKVALENNVTLLLEGYVNNILSTTKQATRLIELLGNEGLGFVMDPFNLMKKGDKERQEEAYDEMFTDIIANCPIAHAKDVIYTEKGISTPRVGTGWANWAAYATRLKNQAPDIPLFMEHLQPSEVTDSIAFIQKAFKD